MINFERYKQLVKDYSNQELTEQLEILTELKETSWDNFNETSDTGYLDVMEETKKQIEFIEKEIQLRKAS